MPDQRSLLKLRKVRRRFQLFDCYGQPEKSANFANSILTVPPMRAVA